MNQFEELVSMHNIQRSSLYKESLLASPQFIKTSILNNNSNWNAFKTLYKNVDIFRSDPLGFGDIGYGNNYRDIHELYIKTDIKLGGQGLNYLNTDNPTVLTKELIQTINSGEHITGANPTDYSIHHIEGRVEPYVSDPNYLILVTNEEHTRINNNTSTNIYEKQNYDEMIKENLRQANSTAFWNGIWASLWMGFLIGFLSELLHLGFRITVRKGKTTSNDIMDILKRSLISGAIFSMIAIPIFLLNTVIFSIIFRIFGFSIGENGVVVLSSTINMLLFLGLKVYMTKKQEKSNFDLKIFMKNITSILLLMLVISYAFNLIGLVGTAILLAIYKFYMGEDIDELDAPKLDRKSYKNIKIIRGE